MSNEIGWDGIGWPSCTECGGSGAVGMDRCGLCLGTGFERPSTPGAMARDRREREDFRLYEIERDEAYQAEHAVEDGPSLDDLDDPGHGCDKPWEIDASR